MTLSKFLNSELDWIGVVNYYCIDKDTNVCREERMQKLNRELLAQVKRAFVAQPGGQGEPVAGASQMTAGMTNPMGGDPSQGGGGGAPAGMDPSMMGGGAPAGMDPAMAGMLGGGAAPQAPQGSSTITLTIDDLIKLFKVFQKNSPGGAAPAAAPAAPAAPGSDPKIDHIIELLHGALGGK